MLQKTIRQPIELKGIGLHSGRETRMRITPASPDSGIVFKIGEERIRAIYSNSHNSLLCSTLVSNRYKISTVEHLLATLYALNINNAFIEIDNEEVPILDGSALIFAENILRANIRLQDSVEKRIIVRREIAYTNNNSYAIVRPSSDFRIKFTIDFKSRLIGRQSLSIKITPEIFIREIAPARTFCEYQEIEHMRSLGLIKGGSLENAIVVDDMRILNSSPLRFIDEFVRHKILDAIGDISLIGYPVSGEFEFYKTGHNANQHLINNIFSNKLNFEIIDTPEITIEEKKKISEEFSHLPEIIPSYS